MFLTRKQHDVLLDANQPLLLKLFQYPHQWGYGGVRFNKVPSTLIFEAREYIK